MAAEGRAWEAETTPNRPLPIAIGITAESGVSGLTKVVVDDNESFEQALKRFNKIVQGDRILSEVRRRRFFEKPSIVRKRKKAAKVRKSRRQTLKFQRTNNM